MAPKAEQALKEELNNVTVPQTSIHSRIAKFLQAAAIVVAIFCLLHIIVLLRRSHISTFSRERLGVSWADYPENSKQPPNLPAYTS